jgi:enediyne biosynthesis protein E4
MGLAQESVTVRFSHERVPQFRRRASFVIHSTLLMFAVFSRAQEHPAHDTAAPVSSGFVDVTQKVGISFEYRASHTSRKYLLETMGPGVALFDYDNDGRLDIFLVNGAPLLEPTPKKTIPAKTGPEYWNRLFHQKSDGTFEDATEKAGLQGFGYGMGVAVGDYDNDGFEDLYVTAYGGNRLYHNNGNGTFSDVSQAAGVAGGGWSTSAAWVDLDNDGALDLIVLRYLDWDFDEIWCGEHKEGYRAYCHPDFFKPISPLVYHNNKDGTFTEISRKIGLAKPGKGLGLAIADYDHDGHIDFFVANDSMAEFLYHNRGDGTFEEVGLVSQVAVDMDGRTYAGMGVDFADYNNDGWADVVVTDLANQRYALYQNSGDGSFNYSTPGAGLGQMTVSHSGWGVRFFDYDNDGWKDLLIAQGHDLDTIEVTYPNLRYREPMLLAHNTGHGFIDVSREAGSVFTQPWVARGMAVGDLDNDGRLDAVVTTNDGPVHVLHNEFTNSNHWLLLNLVGHLSNRDAIGAEVTITTGAGSQYATVSTGGSYLSASDKRVHFGLGKETVVHKIEIRWPSGIRQTIKDVRADRILEVDEPTCPVSARP